MSAHCALCGWTDPKPTAGRIEFYRHYQAHHVSQETP